MNGSKGGIFMDKKLRKIGNILVMSMILFTIINAYFVNI